MTDLFAVVADERRRLSEILGPLDQNQWATPSLCRGWTVQDVLAHLVRTAESSALSFLGQMIRHRESPDQINDRLVRDDDRTPAELVAALRAVAESRVHAPGLGARAPLTDITVHSGDMFRPLGLPHVVAESISRTVLDLLAWPRGQLAFGKRGRLKGLALSATDLEWRSGDGPIVEGPAESLIMVMAGRAIALDELSGEGVAALRARLA